MCSVSHSVNLIFQLPHFVIEVIEFCPWYVYHLPISALPPATSMSVYNDLRVITFICIRSCLSLTGGSGGGSRISVSLSAMSESLLEAIIVSERVRTLYKKYPTAMSPNCSVPSTREKLSFSAQTTKILKV